MMYNRIKKQAMLTLMLLATMSSFKSLSAQNHRVIAVQLGLSGQSVQDMGHSPLVYLGTGLFVSAALNKQHENGMFETSIGYSKSTLSPKLNYRMDFGLNRATRSMISAQSAKYYRIGSGKVLVNLGAELAGVFDLIDYHHNANNPISYEISLSAKPSIHLGYKLSESVRLSTKANLSLICYSIRPMRFGLFPTRDLEAHLGEVLSRGKFTLMDKAVQVDVCTSAEIKIRKKHLIVSYGYRAMKNTQSERKASVNHNIGIQIPISSK